jgi:hypothetical protein
MISGEMPRRCLLALICAVATLGVVGAAPSVGAAREPARLAALGPPEHLTTSARFLIVPALSSNGQWLLVSEVSATSTFGGARPLRLWHRGHATEGAREPRPF